MAEKTEQQLIEEMIKKREKFSKGQTLGMEPKPKPDKEAEQGAPKGGWVSKEVDIKPKPEVEKSTPKWRRLIENVTKDILGK